MFVPFNYVLDQDAWTDNYEPLGEDDYVVSVNFVREGLDFEIREWSTWEVIANHVLYCQYDEGHIYASFGGGTNVDKTSYFIDTFNKICAWVRTPAAWDGHPYNTIHLSPTHEGKEGFLCPPEYLGQA